MYHVFLEGGGVFRMPYQGDALGRAIAEATKGAASVVLDGVTPLWEVEPDSKVDESASHHPVIVHFRGDSLGQVIAAFIGGDRRDSPRSVPPIEVGNRTAASPDGPED
jgi:hypothetical protein